MTIDDLDIDVGLGGTKLCGMDRFCFTVAEVIKRKIKAGRRFSGKEPCTVEEAYQKGLQEALDAVTKVHDVLNVVSHIEWIAEMGGKDGIMFGQSEEEKLENAFQYGYARGYEDGYKDGKEGKENKMVVKPIKKKGK